MTGQRRSIQQREIDILHVCATCRDQLTSKEAARHLREGFQRRLQMMEANRLAIETTSAPQRTTALDPYENAELNMHLNSYYFQLRGSLDNLAWCLHYEFSLLGDGDEDDFEVQRRCHLFADRFLKALQGARPKLAAQLVEKAPWAAELKTFRDPVAHRIPLYAVPNVITSQAEVDRFKQLDVEAGSLAAAGDSRGAVEKWEEARRIGTYRPWFTTSGVRRIEPWSIPERIALDQVNFFDISEAVLSTFFPDPRTRAGF